ncbi:MAG: flagellar FlbD family protein [Candidatus Acidiferrales bacterium]|jgi:flagellar protein FlbD
MIQLTRLNHNPLIINSDLIKLIETAPDTTLSLVTGEKIVVLESSAQVVEKIVEFRRRILAELPFQMENPGPSAPNAARQIQFPAGKS